MVPGHGAIASRADLAASLEMLQTVQSRVAKLKAAGKSAADIVAAKPLADLDARWGTGMLNSDAFVQVVLGAE